MEQKSWALIFENYDHKDAMQKVMSDMLKDKAVNRTPELPAKTSTKKLKKLNYMSPIKNVKTKLSPHRRYNSNIVNMGY